MRLPESDVSQLEGLPVCVSAALPDGIVLALTPFNHSCKYRSTVIHGYATIVADKDEKLFAMQLITDRMIPGRWQDSRAPSKVKLQSTTILKIVVESATAKIRAGGPGNNRKDLKDDALVANVWTGMVPTVQVRILCEFYRKSYFYYKLKILYLIQFLRYKYK
jgi:hypothetical protein